VCGAMAHHPRLDAGDVTLSGSAEQPRRVA
jgi:hypothetical protein